MGGGGAGTLPHHGGLSSSEGRLTEPVVVPSSIRLSFCLEIQIIDNLDNPEHGSIFEIPSCIYYAQYASNRVWFTGDSSRYCRL